MQFEKELADVKEKLQKLLSVTSNLDQYTSQAVQPSQGQQHSLKCVNMVSCNPENIVLNFDENSRSPESELKAATFNANKNGTATAVASGMGGVGRPVLCGRLVATPR